MTALGSRSPELAGAPTVLARGTAGPLSAAYAGLVCDLDGVVYRGASAVPGAPDVLRRLKGQGMAIVYATNNASRLPSEVAEHLVSLGVPATAADVVTSAQAGAAELAASLPRGSRVLALGGPGVAAALSEVGLNAVPPGAPDAGAPVEAVLQGLGLQLTVRDFETAAKHVAGGAVWVATNTDGTLPVEWGDAPGNGAYVAVLERTTGRAPLVVGKPFAPLYQTSVDRIGTRAEATLAVGDRLDTDIAGALSAGLDAAWVLSGVHRPSDLVRQPELGRPTWVIGALSELERPYAAVLASADGFSCGGGHVRVAQSGLEVAAGSATPVELVRAGLAALLDSTARGGLEPEDSVRLAGELDGWLDGSPSP